MKRKGRGEECHTLGTTAAMVGHRRTFLLLLLGEEGPLLGVMMPVQELLVLNELNTLCISYLLAKHFLL